MELLIGYDIDWIGVDLPKHDYSPILTRQIPIITNQPALFIGLGVKVITFVISEIRKDARGRLMDDIRDVFNLRRQYPNSIWLISLQRNQYVSHYTLQAGILHTQQRILQSQVFYPGPLKMGEDVRQEWLNSYVKRIYSIIRS